MHPCVRARPSLRTAALVAGFVVLASLPLEAAATTRVRTAIDDDDPALEVAQAAFEIGLEAYRAGDYRRAVDSWTSAHRLLVVAVDDVHMQRVLGFDLAQALLRLHASDRTPRHFDRARILLEDYILWIERPGHAITTAERDDLDHAKELLALVEIDAAAAVAERRGNPLPPIASPSPYPRIDRPPPPPAPAPIRRLQRNANAFIVAGGVSLGFAIAFGAAASVLASDQRQRFVRSVRADRSLAAVAALTAAFGVIGVGALTMGLVKRRAVLRASPTLARTRVGVAIEVAF